MPSATAFFAVEHDRIHELGEHDIAELGIRQDFALFWATTTGHILSSFNFSLDGHTRVGDRLTFGRLAPYLERGLLAILDTLRVEHAAQHVIAHAGQIAHTTAADQHHRVLLQVVAFAGM